MKLATLAAIAALALIAGATNAAVIGTARNENGTVIEFSDGLFPNYCGQQSTAMIISAAGVRTVACYVDDGHVVTLTPILQNSTSTLVLGALAGQPRRTFRLGPAITLPSAAVAWDSVGESAEWITPQTIPESRNPFLPNGN
jgi:hypothetical protein